MLGARTFLARGTAAQADALSKLQRYRMLKSGAEKTEEALLPAEQLAELKAEGWASVLIFLRTDVGSSERKKAPSAAITAPRGLCLFAASG